MSVRLRREETETRCLESDETETVTLHFPRPYTANNKNVRQGLWFMAV